MKAAELTFESLNLGDVVTAEHLVTRDSLDDFARLSGDRSPIHMDRAEAIAAGFSERVAHGALLMAWASEIIGMRLPGKQALLVEIAFRFKYPILMGDRVSLRGEITSLSPATSFIEIDLSAVVGEQKRASGKCGVILR